MPLNLAVDDMIMIKETYDKKINSCVLAISDVQNLLKFIFIILTLTLVWVLHHILPFETLPIDLSTGILIVPCMIISYIQQ